MRPLRTTLLIPLVLGLAGCALPPAVTIVSFMADGISTASSGKTVTDQAISLLAQKDCRLWRLMQGKSICGSEASVVAVAALPPALPLRAASPALLPPEPNLGAAKPLEVAPAEPTPMAPTPSLTVVPAAPAATPTGSDSAPAVAEISRLNTATAQPALTRRPTTPTVAPAVGAKPPMPRAAGEVRVRGEMIIRSGTDEAEARALADSLHAAGATVRPARHGDVTIYEVVMGLSG